MRAKPQVFPGVGRDRVPTSARHPSPEAATRHPKRSLVLINRASGPLACIAVSLVPVSPCQQFPRASACPRVTLPTCPLAAPPRSPLHFCTGALLRFAPLDGLWCSSPIFTPVKIGDAPQSSSPPPPAAQASVRPGISSRIDASARATLVQLTGKGRGSGSRG